MTKTENLITINERGDIRIIEVKLTYDINSYSIDRKTYQYGCKKTTHSTIKGVMGFNGRNILEQAESIFNNTIKKYCDKGYKKLSSLTRKKLQTLSEEDLIDLYGPTKTHSDLFPKLMKPVYYKNCSNSIFNKQQFCTPKLEGLHCLIYLKNDVLYYRTDDLSQGKELKLNNSLYNLLSENKVILDCIVADEIYVTDYISDDPFNVRLNQLLLWKELFNINISSYILLSGWYYINKKYKQFIKDGYKGLIMKNPNKKYAIGQKSSLYMIEIV